MSLVGIPSKPKALVIEDDPEMSNAISAMLEKAGFRTEVVSTAGKAHHRIGFGNADVIILDWLLDNNVKGDEVLRKASRIIGYFSDLQSTLNKTKPKIVTFSSLEPSEIEIPKMQYMQHLDHWHKSISFSEFEMRSRNLLKTCVGEK